MELQTLNEDIPYLPFMGQDIDVAPTGSVDAWRSYMRSRLLDKSYLLGFLDVDDLLGAIEGTGGTLPHDFSLDLFGFTGSPFVRLYERSANLSASPVLLVSDQVASIKAAFGLSISQLAQVIFVKRPTIYSWLDPERAPETLRGANRDRLRTLYGLATTWNQLSDQPLRNQLTSFQIGGSTLLDLLSQSNLDGQRIRVAMTEARTRIAQSAEQESLADRLRAKGFAEIPPSVGARTARSSSKT